MRTSSFTLLVLLVALPAFAAKSGKATHSKSPAHARPTLAVRTLTITDANSNQVQEIHCAGRVPTTLAFQVPIDQKLVVLADANNIFLPPRTTDRTILLIPKEDLTPGTPTTLTVTLEDGTILPFVLSAATDTVDVTVNVIVSLQKRAAPESVEALKTSIGQLRGQLDECQSNAGSAGVSKIAALILKQDADAPAPFERHAVHKLDRQSRLLVEVKQAYRLFNQTYVVLTVQNRDPSRPWVLDHPEVSVSGGGQASDVKVTSYVTEANSLSPDESERIVVSFDTPPQSSGQDYILRLLEHGGSRHVQLDGLAL